LRGYVQQFVGMAAGGIKRIRVHMGGRLGRIIIIAALLTGSTMCWAAPAPVVPGGANAGRVLENPTPLPEPTPAAPPVVVTPQIGVPAPPGAEGALILVKKVIVQGSTVYGNQELTDTFSPYLHEHMTVGKLYEMVAALTRRYHKDGYTLSRAAVPPQDLSDGTVRIRVIEGYIDVVQTQGAYRSAAAADEIIGRIKSYRPLNMKKLERDMLLLNDLAGVTVRAVLKAPESTPQHAAPPGATDLLLVFHDVPAPASATIDNYGSRYAGPYQMELQAGANHLVMPYQQTLVSGTTALPQSHELQDVQVSHRVTLDGEGTTATLQAGYAHTEPGYQLAPSEIISDAYNYGLTVSRPLVRSRTQNLYLAGDIVIKDITTDSLDSRLYHDKLTIVSVSATCDQADPWGGGNLAQLKLSQGLNVLGATRPGSADLSRADGHSDFTRLAATLSRLQTITQEFRLYAAATGQYSWSPLLSSEQFGYGGQQLGRAYDLAEFTGDEGVAGTVELRYSLPVLVPNSTSELFSFYDVGRVWNYHDMQSMEGGASAGVGLRFAYGGHVSGNLTLAQPLTRKVSAPEYGNGYAPRALVSITVKD